MISRTGHNKAASDCSTTGARVQDITRLPQTVLPQMPGADTVIVHVGSNYIRRASSEHLKMDFNEQILALKESLSFQVQYHRRAVDVKNSALHIWLKYYCSSAGVTFIDTFDTFCQHKILYRNDSPSK